MPAHNDLLQVRMSKNRDAAALAIQRTAKGFLTRKRMRQQNREALQIGRLVRGFVTRRRMAQKARLKGIFERIRRQVATSFALTMSLNQKEKAATMLTAFVRGSKSRADVQRMLTVRACVRACVCVCVCVCVRVALPLSSSWRPPHRCHQSLACILLVFAGNAHHPEKLASNQAAHVCQRGEARHA